MQAARAVQAPRYARFAGHVAAEQLAQDPDAMGEARSLFANGCAGCHGSDARGALGFPNLTDNDWLYGNAPEIAGDHHWCRPHGRDARLAGPALGDSGVE